MYEDYVDVKCCSPAAKQLLRRVWLLHKPTENILPKSATLEVSCVVTCVYTVRQVLFQKSIWDSGCSEATVSVAFYRIFLFFKKVKIKSKAIPVTGLGGL
jgi:hypothetical protein